MDGQDVRNLARHVEERLRVALSDLRAGERQVVTLLVELRGDGLAEVKVVPELEKLLEQLQQVVGKLERSNIATLKSVGTLMALRAHAHRTSGAAKE